MKMQYMAFKRQTFVRWPAAEPVYQVTRVTRLQNFPPTQYSPHRRQDRATLSPSSLSTGLGKRSPKQAAAPKPGSPGTLPYTGSQWRQGPLVGIAGALSVSLDKLSALPPHSPLQGVSQALRVNLQLMRLFVFQGSVGKFSPRLSQSLPDSPSNIATICC